MATPPAVPRSAIDAIRRKLREYPTLRTEETAQSITVHPLSPTGFPVALEQHATGYTIFFAGWHERFESEADALSCFALGLSDECRLRVLSRGKFDYRWVLQRQESGVWYDASETGLLIYPFWGRRRERLLQNRIITRT